MKFFIILFLLSNTVMFYGQTVSGIVFESNSDIPIGYVNIGIIGRSFGTISDENGRYSLRIPPEYLGDTLIFSCIGYHSYSVKGSDFIHLNNGDVRLVKREYELTEVVIRPKKVKEKKLGNTANMLSSDWRAPQNKRMLGFEMGLLIKNKRKSFLKEVNWNIAEFTYDTIVFRVHIYKPQEEMKIENNFRGHVYVAGTELENFENILRNPVYVVCTKDNVKNRITVDLRHLDLVVEGDFLITFEYVKISWNGKFRYRCTDPVFMTRHFIRPSRLSDWRVEWGPGPSIWALVDIER